MTAMASSGSGSTSAQTRGCQAQDAAPVLRCCSVCSQTSSAAQWHPLFPAPLCEECFHRAASASTGCNTTQSACCWCSEPLHTPETSQCKPLICGNALSARHPRCYHGSAFCKVCIVRNLGASYYEANSGEDTVWTCVICDKTPVIRACWAHGWGLPSYPHDRRMQQEIQVAVDRLFREGLKSTVNGAALHERPASDGEVCYKRRKLSCSDDEDTSTKEILRAELEAQRQTILQLEQQKLELQNMASVTAPRERTVAGAMFRKAMEAEGVGKRGLEGCEVHVGPLVKETVSCLHVLMNLWREASVQIRQREDMIMAQVAAREKAKDPQTEEPGATMTMAVDERRAETRMPLLRQQEGTTCSIDLSTAHPYMPASLDLRTIAATAELRSSPSSSPLTSSSSSISSSSSSSRHGGHFRHGDGRDAMTELRRLLGDLKNVAEKADVGALLFNGVRLGKGGGSWNGAGSPRLRLGVEKGSMTTLHSKLTASQGVLRNLHDYVEQVLTRAKTAKGDLQRRLEESRNRLVDLASRLEDVNFAVDVLCRMKSEERYSASSS